MVLTAAIISAIATVGSAAVSIKGAKDQQDAQEEANEISAAQESINDIDAKRANVKKARIARAKLLQQSSTAGTTGSSGESGGLSSLQTQLGTANANITGQQETAQSLTNVNERLADKMLFNQSVGAIANTTASISGQMAMKPE